MLIKIRIKNFKIFKTNSQAHILYFTHPSQFMILLHSYSTARRSYSPCWPHHFLDYS